MMPRITSADLLVAVACTALLATFVLVAIALIDKPEKDRDARAEEADAHAWVQRARYGNTWRAQHLTAALATVRALIAAAETGTQTSPASPPPGIPPNRATGPVTAAAAGESPHASPPPLPDPAYAIAHPCHPFEWWQDEEFAEAMATKDGAR